MSSLYIILFFVALVIMELTYFKAARFFRILDHPNDRSLHIHPTIRGGGIIFYLAAALFFAITLRPSLMFIMALTLVSLVGFMDDVRSLSSVVRLAIQLLAFFLVMIDLDVIGLNPVMIGLIFIVSVGALNTFNFMDGINGITGGYGLVALGSLLYVNWNVVHFIDTDFLLVIMMSVLIFCFFNFRKKAMCFAGDVGSMALGFTIIYLLVRLMVATGNYAYAFFLSVYGVDSVLTIIQRLARKENIFKPHKLHLFQVAVDYFKIEHIKMSSLYAGIQLAINAIIILSLKLSIPLQFTVGIALVLMLTGIYYFVKLKLIGAGAAN